MKSFKYIILIFIIMESLQAQTKATSVDLNKFSGKWYVIATIPTRFDKNWKNVTESYTLNEKGNIDVYTTYVKEGDTQQKSVTSKGFPKKETGNVLWKVQFVWPFRADYLIEEVADDYSYTVVGHPKKKFLYIMNRSGKMDESLYAALIERYKKLGYDMGELKNLQY